MLAFRNLLIANSVFCLNYLYVNSALSLFLESSQKRRKESPFTRPQWPKFKPEHLAGNISNSSQFEWHYEKFTLMLSLS